MILQASKMRLFNYLRKREKNIDEEKKPIRLAALKNKRTLRYLGEKYF